MLGHIQDAIVNLGKQKEILIIEDILSFYPPEKVRREMTQLVYLGYFKAEFDGVFIRWRYNESKES